MQSIFQIPDVLLRLVLKPANGSRRVCSAPTRLRRMYNKTLEYLSTKEGDHGKTFSIEKSPLFQISIYLCSPVNTSLSLLVERESVKSDSRSNIKIVDHIHRLTTRARFPSLPINPKHTQNSFKKYGVIHRSSVCMRKTAGNHSDQGISHRFRPIFQLMQPRTARF